MKFSLRPKPPYNFELVASLYSRFPQCVDTYTKSSYKRALEIDGQICLVEVSSTGSVDCPLLEVCVTPSTVNRAKLKKTVSWMLSVEEDFSAFYSLAKKDKKLWGLVSPLYGLHAPKTPTVYEALIIAISEQQIALPVAIALRKRLAEKHGKRILVKGKRYYAFPSPMAIAKARVEDIREMKFSTKKAEYMIDISKKVVSGEIDLEQMKSWEVGKVLETLTQYRGLGPWTVEYMMVRGMGRYDALPAADIGLRNSLTKYLGSKERVSEAKVRAFLQPFGRYKGNAAFYLIYAYAFEKYKNLEN